MNFGSVVFVLRGYFPKRALSQRQNNAGKTLLLPKRVESDAAQCDSIFNYCLQKLFSPTSCKKSYQHEKPPPLLSDECFCSGFFAFQQCGPSYHLQQRHPHYLLSGGGAAIGVRQQQ